MLKKIIKSRYFLLGFVPILSVYVFLGYYYSVGKLIKTDNAYIKAPIISVKSEIAGKVNQVFIKNNQFVYKNQKLINIDTKNLFIKLSENKETLNTILEELQIRKYKLNEIEAEIKISEEDIKFRNREEIRVNNLLKNKREIANNDIKFYQLEFQRQLKLNKKGFGIKKELDVDLIKGLIAKQYENIGEVKKKTDGITQSDDKSMRLTKLSVTTEYSIQMQYKDCWSPPMGAEYKKNNYLVTVKLDLEKNGRVKSREILERNRMGTDGKYRVFAEAVDRAVLMCNPIKNLPPKTYENWSTMILRFNPEGMMVGE